MGLIDMGTCSTEINQRTGNTTEERELWRSTYVVLQNEQSNTGMKPREVLREQDTKAWYLFSGA